MVQAYYIYCALDFFYYYIVLYSEITSTHYNAGLSKKIMSEPNAD